ncbi:hypothetical protein ABT215_18500 [Streptomyces sp900105755]|uniref:hypothetical protein n=1 Tax=Streptomyces sp. 900105755 TaxID=3154389 RepID=UPI003327BA81
MDGVVRKDWREAVVDDKGRIERIPYELCVRVALRDAIRRREIYIEGGRRWGDPEDDLPGVRRRPEAADDGRPWTGCR